MASTPPPFAAVPQLTARMARGDEEAFREFFARYFHRLLAYLIVLSNGNEEHARELLQQTMIKVARHIKPMPDEDALWRWLTVLARTAAADEGRKSKRYFTFLERLWGAPAPAPDPQPNELESLLNEQLSALEPEDRTILELKYVIGRSVREIAAQIGISEKAVESRLTRLRTKLRQSMQGHSS